MNIQSVLTKIRTFLSSDLIAVFWFLIAALIIIFNIEIPGSIYMGFLICAVLILTDDLVAVFLPALLLISFAIRNKNSFDAYMEYLWGIPIVAFAVLFHIIAYRKQFTLHKGKLLIPMCATVVALFLGGVGSMTFAEYTTKINLSYMFALGPLVILAYVFIGGVLGPGKNYTEHMDERFSKIMVTVSSYLVFSIGEYYVEHWEEFIFDPDILPFQWRNNACTIMMLAMPFCFFMAKKKNFAYVLVSFASYAAMIMSGSRGGLLFGGIELIILIIYYAIVDKKHRKILLSIVGVAVVACVALIPKLSYLLRYTIDRFTSHKENFRRMGLLGRSVEDFLSNPAFGRGIGYMGNRDLHPSAIGQLCWYHSSIPQVIGSFGIAGILAYGYQFLCRIKFFLEKKSDFSKAVFLSFIALELMSLVNPGIFAPAYLILITIIFALSENYEEVLYEQ